MNFSIFLRGFIVSIILLVPLTSRAADLQPGEARLDIEGVQALASITLAEDVSSLKGKPVVLIVHGTLAHKDMSLVTAQSRLLAERGYNVVALSLTYGLDDRRGLYDCKVPHTHTHDDALIEIAAWMDWLDNQGAGPVVLMGHSRGGAQTALYMAEQKDSRIKALVLAAPMTFDADAVAKGFEKNHGQPLSKVIDEMKGLEPDAPVDGIGLLYCPGASVTPAAFLNYYGEGAKRRDTPTILEGITVPTLVAIASNDDVVRVLPAGLKARSYEGVSIVTISDAGHMFLDFASEDLADSIDVFIQDTIVAP